MRQAELLSDVARTGTKRRRRKLPDNKIIQVSGATTVMTDLLDAPGSSREAQLRADAIARAATV